MTGAEPSHGCASSITARECGAAEGANGCASTAGRAAGEGACGTFATQQSPSQHVAFNPADSDWAQRSVVGAAIEAMGPANMKIAVRIRVVGLKTRRIDYECT